MQSRSYEYGCVDVWNTLQSYGRAVQLKRKLTRPCLAFPSQSYEVDKPVLGEDPGVCQVYHESVLRLWSTMRGLRA